MANLKSLFKDTVIYGLSSIVGRFLNYLLVPLYTTQIAASTGGYGVITNIYSYTALFLVLLTFGMETTFFRFMGKRDADGSLTYTTALVMVGGVCLCFAAAVLCFLPGVSAFMGYAATPEYVGVMAVCVAVDAFMCIPFAYLRYHRRAVRFACLKLLFIALNIVLNVAYFWALPLFVSHSGGTFRVDVGYVFYINLLCSLLVVPFFRKELFARRWRFSAVLARRMLSYSWPILLLGVAGILSQTADKILYPSLRPGHGGQVELGVYGACVKIAMIMAMITQAFRYAYEPFVFAGAEERNSRASLAKAMKFFIIFTLLAFLLVMAWMPLLRHVVAPDYWEGLSVVPVVMTAEIMMGIYFNLSFWYKLIDRTIWGAWFSGAGCLVLLLVNVWGVPRWGYQACAWAGVAGYGTAMLLSYFVGQKKNPIDYPLRSIFIYVLLCAILTLVVVRVGECLPTVWALLVSTLCVAAFVGYTVWRDLPELLHRRHRG